MKRFCHAIQSDAATSLESLNDLLSLKNMWYVARMGLFASLRHRAKIYSRSVLDIGRPEHQAVLAASLPATISG